MLGGVVCAGAGFGMPAVCVFVSPTTMTELFCLVLGGLVCAGAGFGMRAVCVCVSPTTLPGPYTITELFCLVFMLARRMVGTFERTSLKTTSAE